MAAVFCVSILVRSGCTMASFEPTPRDPLIQRVRIGELTPEEAEAVAEQRGFGPIQLLESLSVRKIPLPASCGSPGDRFPILRNWDRRIAESTVGRQS